jgi:transposase
LREAEEELRNLTRSGKGRRVWSEEQPLRQAIAAIEKEHGVEGLLEVSLREEQKETKRHRKPGRPKETSVPKVEVEVRYRIEEVRRKEEEIQQREERLGYRALVSNASEQRLTFEGCVLTYREGGGLERPFHQLKDAPLGIRPLFVRLNEQVVGLTRLVLIALRVLTLVEIVVRSKLAAAQEELEGTYEGQKSRKEGNPTARRLLRAIARLEITLSLVVLGDQERWYLTPLPKLLVRVLELLGLPISLYTDLTHEGPRSPPDTLPTDGPGPAG